VTNRPSRKLRTRRLYRRSWARRHRGRVRLRALKVVRRRSWHPISRGRTVLSHRSVPTRHADLAQFPDAPFTVAAFELLRHPAVKSAPPYSRHGAARRSAVAPSAWSSVTTEGSPRRRWRANSCGTSPSATIRTAWYHVHVLLATHPTQLCFNRSPSSPAFAEEVRRIVRDAK
jgi:hypothetical protein